VALHVPLLPSLDERALHGEFRCVYVRVLVLSETRR
jgi:hypothetical protein